MAAKREPIMTDRLTRRRFLRGSLVTAASSIALLDVPPENILAVYQDI
jgi:hypothetical protein